MSTLSTDLKSCYVKKDLKVFQWGLPSLYNLVTKVHQKIKYIVCYITGYFTVQSHNHMSHRRCPIKHCKSYHIYKVNMIMGESLRPVRTSFRDFLLKCLILNLGSWLNIWFIWLSNGCLRKRGRTMEKSNEYGILLPKLFWPTVRKKCSSDREKLLK